MINPIEDHNRLDAVHDQLVADGHHELAEVYALRYAAAQKGFTTLRDLGRFVEHAHEGTFGKGADLHDNLGKQLADYLTDQGWSPPWPLTIDDEDTTTEGEHP